MFPFDFQQLANLNLSGAHANFNESYRVRPLSRCGRSELEAGDKIIMPVQFPMQFRLSDFRNEKATHVGVAEFSSDQYGAPHHIFVPQWVSKKFNSKK
jgi:Ubiquitin fusion degradation protein UFD1